MIANRLNDICSRLKRMPVVGGDFELMDEQGAHPAWIARPFHRGGGRHGLYRGDNRVGIHAAIDGAECNRIGLETIGFVQPVRVLREFRRPSA